MPFQNVVVAGLAHAEAPHRITSAQIEDRLAPTYDRLGIKRGLLRTIAGIEARRWFDPGTPPSAAATLAAEKLLAEVDVPRERIGVLVNTSVCRDFLEPSTASIIHGNLGLPTACRNFDLGNACLAFINAMELIGLQIEHGLIDYALIVDGEHSREVQEATIERMSGPDMTEAQFRREFASLTLGSGGVAMLLARRALCPDGPSIKHGVMRSATEHAKLCWGNPTQMQTDTRGLLFAGVQLAQRTFNEAGARLGWSPDVLDLLVLHQVSAVHTTTLCRTLGLDPAKAHLTFPEYGNIGPASVPYTLSMARDAGRVKKGDRVALMGIGSGLNCAMFEVEW